MTRYTPQWLQAGSYPASADRRLIGALWPSAAVNGMAVSSSGGMTLNIAPGQAAVPSQNSTGSTLCTSDANENVTIGPAPGANNRIDLVTVQPRGADLDGGANNDFVFNVVSGAVAAAPVAPATPPGQTALAQVYVGQGVATINAANITDVRPFGLPVGSGGGVPPALGSGAPFQSFTDGSGEVWVAKGGVNGGAWKKARDVLTARWARSAALTIGSGSTPVAMDTVARDTYGLYATDRYIAPVPGWYNVSGWLGFTPTASAQYLTVRIYINGTLAAITGGFTGGSSSNLGVALPFYLLAGDQVMIYGTAPNLALAIGTWSWFSMQYIGSG
jgi:hypothetical protein